ncbi:hypothetical protein K3X41_11150 [Aliiroseovarius crassostreae]|uniref:DUF7946 domain-containing protein n=1 Tax=Aliiroseovarius crassostreae TaxID=154981 RepID=UPI002203EBE7|nr:hypothetical protein [Aliiroseovarius crassostreae]UWQ10453.1 hypothetical protein K3X41_11150 [Aliiroseovarius crassostreae]
MQADVDLEFVFNGNDASTGQVQFYDLAQALVGIERTISLTNHLLITGDVITQSPSAKYTKVFISPPEKGSWKAGIGIFFGTALTIGVASKDSALGYLAVSALDYVIQHSLGFEVDFDETLGPQIKKAKERDIIPIDLDEQRFDSLIEKVENSLRLCHRPMVHSESATNAVINWRTGGRSGRMDGFFDLDTYEHISKTLTREDIEDFVGIISSYNVNTAKGRVYVEEMERTIPFELGDEVRGIIARRAVAGSLYENSAQDNIFSERIILRGFGKESANGRLKSIYVVGVNPDDEQN